MIRESTFASATHWDKPTVAEVAEIINLLKDYGYDSKKLTLLTGLQDKKVSDWMSGYRREPAVKSNIPYPCWSFLAALAGRPNIHNQGAPIEVDARKVMRAFKPTAFKPSNKFEMPSAREFRRVIGENAFTGMTVENLSETFQWKPAQFEQALETGSLPFLNWCLILMHCGFNVQRMLLNEHEGEISLED